MPEPDTHYDLKTTYFFIGIYHWSLHWGCLRPGRPRWSCLRCAIDCPVRRGTAACSAGCWMSGTAGTSPARNPPDPLYSAPVKNPQKRCSAFAHWKQSKYFLPSEVLFLKVTVKTKTMSEKLYLYPVFHISVLNNLQHLVFLYGQLVWLRCLHSKWEQQKWVWVHRTGRVKNILIQTSIKYQTFKKNGKC